jgi:hypothetical protein
VYHQVCAAKKQHPCLRQGAESVACSVALSLQSALLLQAEQAAAVQKDCVIQVEVVTALVLLLLSQRGSATALALQAMYH